MLINSAQKMPSIQRRICVEYREPAHQLSTNILGSYLWSKDIISLVLRFLSLNWLRNASAALFVLLEFSGLKAHNSGGNLLSLDSK